MLLLAASFRRCVSLAALCVAAVAVSGCSNDTTIGNGGSNSQTPTLTFATTTLATGTVGSTYVGSVSPGNGTSPYTCTAASTTFGLSLSTSCAVTGTPTISGNNFTIPVIATDASTPQRTGSATFKIVINPAPALVVGGTLPAGEVNAPYGPYAFSVTGGVAPYTCNVPTGTNLDGLTLTSAGCTLSGTPTAAGTFTLTVTATDTETNKQTATGTVTLTVINGPTTRVLAGTQPQIGASVQVYAAGKTGNGSAPTALLSTPLVTDPTGGFTLLSSAYTCPSATSIVYLVATGGKAGLTGTVNSGSKMISSPGACSNLATMRNFVINEATTVASAYAFAQFMATGGNIGASSTNLLGITLASGTLQSLVDTTVGTMPGPNFPTTGTAPSAKINLMATLLNNCIASTGPTSAACTGLYSNAIVGSTTPTNTLDAALNLVKNPATGMTALYTLASAVTTPAYSPIPATQPSDWTLYINFLGGGMNDPTAVSIDSAGRVWVANYFSVASLFSNTGVPVLAGGVTGNYMLDSYGGAVDATDRFWVANEEGGPSGVGTVTVIDKTGTPIATSPFTQGGLNFPISVAFDKSGYGWIVDYGNSHLTILDSTGASATGTANPSGYTTSQFIFPVAVGVDSNRTGWIANQSSNTVTSVSADGNTIKSYVVGFGPSGVAVDKSNNIWTANYYGDSVGLVSSTGTVLSGSTGFVGGGVNHPQGIATDGAGTVWVTNYRKPGMSQFAGASAATPGAPLSPDSVGWAPDASLLEAFGIAIDPAGNLWITNFGSNTLTEFVGMASPVKTPLIGPAVAP